LIAAILLLSIASGRLIEKKNLARTISKEGRSLEIEFVGSCRDWRDKVKSTATVNTQTRCLPIQVGVAQNPDTDDLNAHVFCTNVDENRSVIHFVEIFSGLLTIDGNGNEVSVDNFVVSFIPTAPFRVLTDGVTLMRRPNCFTTQDYCNGTNYVVNGCTANEVVLAEEPREERPQHHESARPEQTSTYGRPEQTASYGNKEGNGRPQHGNGNGRPEGNNNGAGRPNEWDDDRDKRATPEAEERYPNRHRKFVVNHDRIYIISNQQTSDVCKTSASECCPYITHESFGGICNNAATQDLNVFPTEHRAHDFDGDHHQGRPHGNGNGNGRPHHN